MKTCLYCKGDLENRAVTLDRRSRNELFVIEDVPALVCRQCGETFLDGPVVEQIDAMIKTGKPIAREINVPVMKFLAA